MNFIGIQLLSLVCETRCTPLCDQIVKMLGQDAGESGGGGGGDESDDSSDGGGDVEQAEPGSISAAPAVKINKKQETGKGNASEGGSGGDGGKGKRKAAGE